MHTLKTKTSETVAARLQQSRFLIAQQSGREGTQVDALWTNSFLIMENKECKLMYKDCKHLLHSKIRLESRDDMQNTYNLGGDFKKKKVLFVAFGEVNTPFAKLQMMHDKALAELHGLFYDITDAGVVVDDPQYERADAAVTKFKAVEADCLIICVAGWVPTHAVIRVTDHFRHMPILLWGLCSWYEKGKLITTAGQAGTAAIRPAFEALGYTFKFVYDVVGKPSPLRKIDAFITAAYARRALRRARVGSMGYRDMLLYGTQFEGNAMRGQLGVEVETFEMLEMVQNLETLDEAEVQSGVDYVKSNWIFAKPCEKTIIEMGVRYALAVGKRIAARGYEAVTLLNISKVKEGYVTCARLIYLKGRYKLHIYTGEAKTPVAWSEFGWEEPAPQLPSLQVFSDKSSLQWR